MGDQPTEQRNTGEQEPPPWAGGDMPDPNLYVESELFVAGAISTLPPFNTFHPAWALPIARQALYALGEWEPSDNDSQEATEGEQAAVATARFLTPGEAGVLANLRREAEQIATLERQLAAAKKRRDLLIVKARRCSIPERQIEPYAGVSNVRVGQIARAWEAEHADSYTAVHQEHS